MLGPYYQIGQHKWIKIVRHIVHYMGRNLGWDGGDTSPDFGKFAFLCSFQPIFSNLSPLSPTFDQSPFLQHRCKILQDMCHHWLLIHKSILNDKC